MHVIEQKSYLGVLGMHGMEAFRGSFLLLAGYTPLALAAQAGNADVVQHLLHQGADPNLHKSGAAGPLHCAAASGPCKSADLLLLLQCNASWNQRMAHALHLDVHILASTHVSRPGKPMVCKPAPQGCWLLWKLLRNDVGILCSTCDGRAGMRWIVGCPERARLLS